MGIIIGYDTSCYTTSVAAVDTDGCLISNRRRMLEVGAGERGLRQSEALFQHIRALPDLTDSVMKLVHGAIEAVCVSAKPRDGNSYMPVFLAGVLAARSMAAGLSVPCYETTHQLGHIYAGCGTDMPDSFFALHISGGTTDALFVEEGNITRLGGSHDLHAGQFIDRVGVALGLPFPAGSELEKLAISEYESGRSASAPLLSAPVKGMTISFSGVESQAQRLIAAGAECVAYSVFSCISRGIYKLIENITSDKNGELPVVLVGGVAASSFIKREIECRAAKRRPDLKLHFAPPALAGDNAVGVAIIGGKRLKSKDDR